MEANPHYKISYVIEVQPYRDLALRDRIVDDLRAAGFPEWLNPCLTCSLSLPFYISLVVSCREYREEKETAHDEHGSRWAKSGPGRVFSAGQQCCEGAYRGPRPSGPFALRRG